MDAIPLISHTLSLLLIILTDKLLMLFCITLLLKVKKQQLAVTMEMKLAQEEADKYRTIFGMASEVAQNLEKVQ